MSQTPLADILLSAIAEPTQSQLGSRDRLDSELRGLLDEAASALGGLELAPEVFLPYLADRVAGVKAEAPLEGLCVGDLYLACACLEGDDEASSRLGARLGPVLDKALAPFGLSPDQRTEVTQRVLEKLLVCKAGRPASISSYSGRGRLDSWLRVVAVRECRDLLKAERRSRAAGDDSLIDHLAPQDDPELVLLKERYRTEFAQAVRAAFAALPAKSRTLLRYHYVDGLSIDGLGRVYSVHRATAARWLVQAREELKDGTRREMESTLRVDRGELDSIIRLIQSQLHVTLSQLLSRAG